MWARSPIAKGLILFSQKIKGHPIDTDSTYEEFDRAKFTARSRLWVATIYR